MKRNFTTILGILAILGTSVPPIAAESTEALKLFAEVEQGFLKVAAHRFQSGAEGTDFDFVTQGGQELLFPVNRAKLGLQIADRHLLTAVYQPLLLETQVSFREDVTIDGVLFAEGTRMNLSYGFPFWRFSYGFDLLPQENLALFAGLALQLRNASIRFESADGSIGTTNQNLGPVPALFAQFDYTFDSGIQLGAEATGSYASSAFFNGADFDFEGSLLDASLRVSFPVYGPASTFLSLRYLGGTAVGTSNYEARYWTQSQERFTSNKLSTLILSAGLRLF